LPKSSEKRSLLPSAGRKAEPPWGVIMGLLVRRGFAALLVLAATSLSAAAAGAPQVYTGITKSGLHRLLDAQHLGYADKGDYLILDNGLVILATDCENDKHVCNEIQFSRIFADVRPPVEAVNEWNRSYKIPEASVDKEGRLHLEMWLSAIGMTDVIFFDTLQWFEKAWPSDKYWQAYVKKGAGA
jgi:hypothetical protein